MLRRQRSKSISSICGGMKSTASSTAIYMSRLASILAGTTIIASVFLVTATSAASSTTTTTDSHVSPDSSTVQSFSSIEQLNRLAFSFADADQNGFIDRTEVEVTAKESMGHSWLRSSHIDRIVRMGDVNGDGVIDFEEFVSEAPIKVKQRLAGFALVAMEQQNTSTDGMESSILSVSSAASTMELKKKRRRSALPRAFKHQRHPRNDRRERSEQQQRRRR